jgi:5-methylcytosine-specific restriction endonuclease McrA
MPTYRKAREPKPGTVWRRRHLATKKAQLIADLGGVCVGFPGPCGTTEDLTFDHINGRDWDIRAVHSTKRLRIYVEEASQGKLQLLCRACNTRKRNAQNGVPDDSEPF